MPRSPPAIIGLSAVQEFVTRGPGPRSLRSPKRIVTTGLYAYVRNPMQLSAVLLLCLLGLALQNVWLAVAGIMAHIYSVGLAGSDKDDDRKALRTGVTAYRVEYGVVPECGRTLTAETIAFTSVKLWHVQ